MTLATQVKKTTLTLIPVDVHLTGHQLKFLAVLALPFSHRIKKALAFAKAFILLPEAPSSIFFTD
jgi:hypothetical protein